MIVVLDDYKHVEGEKETKNNNKKQTKKSGIFFFGIPYQSQSLTTNPQ